MSGVTEDFQQKLQSIGQQFKPENVQIIKNGKTISPEGIDDYDSFMQFLMLASIASYFADRRPTGRVDNFPFQATETLLLTNLLYPGQSMSITNDGPSPVGVWVNSHHGEPHTVAIGEAYHVDFETHIIRCFYTQCNPGDTAQLRVTVQE